MSKISKSKIENFDKNEKISTAGEMSIKWFSADDTPLRLSGFYFRKPGEGLRRMPIDKRFRYGVDVLAWNTAGGQLAFKTNSSRIRVKVKLGHESHMDHMTKIGSSGFDLYCGTPKHWYFLAPTRIGVMDTKYEVDIIKDMSHEMRGFILNFPLYSGVEDFALGVDPDAEVMAPDPWLDERPIVVYGTSITQGGCANRPGMVYTNILSRKWNLPLLNFGFSNAGRGEEFVLETLAKINNPRMYILDYEANTYYDGGIKTTLERSVDILRKKHPNIPILIISSSKRNREILYNNSKIIRDKLYSESIAFQTEFVATKRAAGDPNIYYLSGAWPGHDEEWDEYTIDGCHASDLGFYYMAKTIGEKVEKILGL